MSDVKRKLVDDEEVDRLLEELDVNDKTKTSNHGSQVLEAAVVPIGKPLKRGRGRPANVHTPPAPSVAEYNRAIIAQQVAFVENDEVVKAMSRRVDSVGTLHMLKERIARSAATLEFIRLQQQREGKYNREIPQVVSRQVAALKDIAHIELEIRKLGAVEVDLTNPKIQAVFKLLIDTFRDVLEGLLDPSEFDLVWNKLETELEGWEEKADGLVR